MSNNNKTDCFSITDTKKYIVTARQKILDMLKNTYQMSDDKASQTEENIAKYIQSQLTEKYGFKTSLYGDNDVFTHITKDVGAQGWLFTALTVPFYESLGDTIGYYNGNWEFNRGEKNAGPDYVNVLVSDFISMGGVNDLSIINWMSSDDTILYMATWAVLVTGVCEPDEFGKLLRTEYLSKKNLIQNRDPGQTTMDSLEMQESIEWNKLPYNSKAIGAGSAMRSGCIGMFFPTKFYRRELISFAVECSRVTHNSATAILGSVTAALFTAYALERQPINLWPHKLLKLLKSGKIDSYIEFSRPNEYPFFKRDKVIFIGQWEKYISFRFAGINVRTDIRLTKNLVLRYKYLSENYSKGCDVPGSCADDCLIMAYDALLESGGVFEKLLVYSILHPGDSDTVGSIAMSWFGALYHSPRNQLLIGHRFDDLEFNSELSELAEKSVNRMLFVYYYAIYIHYATNYINQNFKKHS